MGPQLRSNFLVTAAFFVLSAASLLFSGPTAQAQVRIPINIESVPPGATVYLDTTTSAPLGTTPLSNIRVARGDHTFIFQLANHEEARLAVTVQRRRETFRAVLRALGTIEVSAANEGANGAQVFVDGRPMGALGSTPVRVTDLQPGRHEVRVEREGYVNFAQWVEVSGGQLVRVPAMLEAQAPDTGEILVAGPSGAPILLDGQPAGTTPTVLDGIPAGAHTVEIQAPGQPPFSQQVMVFAGQRATVSMPTEGRASLRVLANVESAIIRIDGEVIGPSPAVREGLSPGEHIIEATAEGYETARQTVTLEAGQPRVVAIDLQRVMGEPGRILVNANVDGASVTIDNQELGTAPLVADVEPGPHAVVVRAEGHDDYSTTCTTAPGQNCEVDATLVPQQVRVRIAVQGGVRDAQLLVNGEPAGPVPYDGTLPAGSHVLTVTAPGYEDVTQQALLMPSSEVRDFTLILPEGREGEEERERLERERAASVTHSAAPLPVNQASLDMSLGWPYLAEIRLNVGLLDFLDAGFAIRSFGRLTEFEGRVRAGFRPLQQLAVGGQVRFGGGIGPELGFAEGVNPPVTCTSADVMDPMSGCTSTMQMREARPDEVYGRIRPETPERTDATHSFSYPINSIFMSLELLGSLHFGEQGAFTLWLGMDLSSDEYAGHPLNSGVFLTNDPEGNPYCTVQSDNTLSCPREDWARARLGGSLELVLTRHWNIWFILEGILNSSPRRIMGNLLGIEANDTQFYFRLGTTYKF